MFVTGEDKMNALRQVEIDISYLEDEIHELREKKSFGKMNQVKKELGKLKMKREEIKEMKVENEG